MVGMDPLLLLVNIAKLGTRSCFTVCACRSFFRGILLTCSDNYVVPVRALHDYQATIPQEFSFQADDIIAVFEADGSGWWQGELLDENRRVPGKHTFPSTFTTLLE